MRKKNTKKEIKSANIFCAAAHKVFSRAGRTGLYYSLFFTLIFHHAALSRGSAIQLQNIIVQMLSICYPDGVETGYDL